jgi:hypothetical protein
MIPKELSAIKPEYAHLIDYGQAVPVFPDTNPHNIPDGLGDEPTCQVDMAWVAQWGNTLRGAAESAPFEE